MSVDAINESPVMIASEKEHPPNFHESLSKEKRGVELYPIARKVRLKRVGKDLTSGAIIFSKERQMCSVGQLQAKTMCGLGFLGFWILDRK